MYSRKKGQTLPEVLVSLAILAIVMSSVFNLVLTSFSYVQSIRTQTAAVGKTEEVLNEMVSRSQSQRCSVDTAFIDGECETEYGIQVCLAVTSLSAGEPGQGATVNVGGVNVEAFKKVTATATWTIPHVATPQTFVESRIIRVVQ